MIQSSPASFYKKTREARKIIVVDLGFVGDSVHLIPALWEIKRHYPGAALHVLSAPAGREVIELAPSVDRAWAFPLQAKSPPWWRHWNVVRELRCERFDLAFNFSGADRTIFLTALTGAKWRLAQQGARKHFWNSWLIDNWVPRQSANLPVFEQRRQVLRASGFSLEGPRFDLQVPEEALAWAASAISQNAIHLSINASTYLKEWPLKHWIALVRILSLAYPRQTWIATCGPNDREQERLRRFGAALNDEHLLIMPKAVAIAQLAALLKRCRLHVGVDSGITHLAMALGTPTFSLFREYAGTGEWLPPGKLHRHLTVACACAEQRFPDCLRRSEAACLERIAPQAVAAILREQIGE